MEWTCTAILERIKGTMDCTQSTGECPAHEWRHAVLFYWLVVSNGNVDDTARAVAGLLHNLVKMESKRTFSSRYCRMKATNVEVCCIRYSRTFLNRGCYRHRLLDRGKPSNESKIEVGVLDLFIWRKSIRHWNTRSMCLT